MNRFLFVFTGLIISLTAQDDMLELIDNGTINPIPVQATFKATRIVNSQSIELTRPKTLEFMILHRFGSMTNGFYDLFGMDEATIRFDLKYGINDRISLGAGRSSLNKTYDIFTKLNLLKQTSGGSFFPFSLALFSKMEISTIDQDLSMSDKLTFDIQVLAARKFNPSISVQVMPTFIHRNLVQTAKESHDLLSFGIGGRVKATKRISMNADTFFPLGERNESFKQSWGLGCDIETGGHVFQLMITNVQGSFESEYIENASGTFDELNLFLGFNITRVFTI
ncbi:MAG: DUF5777 family beta-barrel protein [Candidatus Neomarinimicrobiota bacterium]|jgi:hypothetical protein|nr:DUF5777 family beta-barrel protein [Candidatus Neomarinimicrobiota bacterium]